MMVVKKSILNKIVMLENDISAIESKTVVTDVSNMKVDRALFR